MTLSRFHTCFLQPVRFSLTLVLLLLAVPAQSEFFQTQASEAIRSIAEVAPDANLIFIVDDAARQRRSESGDAMTDLLGGLGMTGSDGALRAAWAGLSQKIGMTEDEAFDKLFGRRAIFVSDGMTIAGGGEWAIASVVPTKLAYKALESLGAKRRDIDAGHTIFAIEDGAYRISLVRPRDNELNNTDARLFVVAPRESKDLFRRLVRGLSKPKGWEDLVGQNRRLQPQIAGVFRADGQDVGVINILQSDSGWQGQALFDSGDADEKTVGWSGTDLDRLASGAWLAVAESADVAALMSTPVGRMMSFEPGLALALENHLTRRLVLTIRPARGGVSMLAAFETDGSVEAAAAADAAMRNIAQFLTGRGDATPDYQGFMAHATRTTKLDGLLIDEFLGDMIGKSPTLSWLTLHGDDSNWWAMRLGPESEHDGVALRSLVRQLPAGAEGGRNSSIGYARPGPLAAMLDRVIESDQPIEKPIRQVELIRWSERPRPGKTEIGFEFRMNGSKD